MPAPLVRVSGVSDGAATSERRLQLPSEVMAATSSPCCAPHYSSRWESWWNIIVEKKGRGGREWGRGRGVCGLLVKVLLVGVSVWHITGWLQSRDPLRLMATRRGETRHIFHKLPADLIIRLTFRLQRQKYSTWWLLTASLDSFLCSVFYIPANLIILM